MRCNYTDLKRNSEGGSISKLMKYLFIQEINNHLLQQILPQHQTTDRNSEPAIEVSIVCRSSTQQLFLHLLF